MSAWMGLVHGLQTSDFMLLGSEVSRAEWLGALLGVAMVVCNARMNPAGWLLALLSSLMYGLVFYGQHLYGQAALQLLFAAMAVWGWLQWTGAVRADSLAPCALPATQRLKLLGLGLVGWLLLGTALDFSGQHPAPWMDALTTAGSVAATWLLARRHIENRQVWLAVNVLSVVLFVHEALWLTALFYALLALMSAWGWRQWRAQAQAQTQTQAPT